MSDPCLLIIDDDETFATILCRNLKRKGFDASVALNLEQGQQLAQELTPEYAIVDLCIGTESGLEFVAYLKATLPDIKIVVLTGYASIATAIEAIKLGAIHYLTKPTELDDIIDAFSKTQGNASIEPQKQRMSVKRFEWEYLQKVLSEHDGNISAAARALGMHRRTLQRKLQKRPVNQ